MKREKSIHESKYIISDNSPQHLIELGFHKDCEQEEKYTYNFIVLRYERTTVLRGIITVHTDTNEVQIDVTDNNYTAYAPFYNVEYGNYNDILNKINKAILKEFSKLKIVKDRSQ